MIKIKIENPKNRNNSSTELFSRVVQNLLSKDIQLFGGSYSDKQKERFYSELNVLFSSGIDIRTALEIIEEEQSKEKEKIIFRKIKDEVVAGKSLSDALQSTGKFSNYEFFSLQIGEESGRLPYVLAELTTFYSKKIKQKRQIISALTYPIIVLLSSFGAIYFMMTFVVPLFSDIFKRYNGELPFFTRLVIKVSGWFENYSFLIFATFFSLVLFFYFQRNSIWFRRFASKVVLKIPILNEIILKIYLSRFCFSMNLLLSSKTPLVRAIELVRGMVGFYPIESALSQVQSSILKGDSLYKSLSFFPIFNNRFIALIKVSEEVNQMDKMFERIGKQYSDEVEHQTSVLSKVVEPLILIFLGIVVAVILIAIYLPMLQIGNIIG